ncbi:uncharacterized protein LOC135483474 [Lineus longissimus]|uniref:uncharacterized protein LOC135483474 n=1 Tax=Lineus longissimus TaxID=88925 RepID=UPI002B4CF78D
MRQHGRPGKSPLSDQNVHYITLRICPLTKIRLTAHHRLGLTWASETTFQVPLRLINLVSIPMWILRYCLILLLMFVSCKCSHPVDRIHKRHVHRLLRQIKQIEMSQQTSKEKPSLLNIIKKSREKRGALTAEQRKQCCPYVTETISPLGGFDRSNRILQLYRDKRTTQKFYQTRCLSGIENHPCKFAEKSIAADTHCVQKDTYQYAVVRDFGVPHQPYRIDFIRVKSACTCEMVL